MQEVLEEMPDPPSYSAVRATMRVLEDKGRLRHKEEGRKYVYHPAVAPERVLLLPDGDEDLWNEGYAELVALA